MKIEMPEPKVGRDGVVTLMIGRQLQRLGMVCQTNLGWWAEVDEDRRHVGWAYAVAGLRTQHQAVRWLVIHAIDWRTYP